MLVAQHERPILEPLLLVPQHERPILLSSLSYNHRTGMHAWLMFWPSGSFQT